MTALLAQSQRDAAEQIEKLIKECRDGASDREGEAVAHADQVRRGFAGARELRGEAGGGLRRRKLPDDPPNFKEKSSLVF
jgi:hypothetical protein